MSLNEITRVLLQPNKKEITTYKLFNFNGGHFMGMFLHHRYVNKTSGELCFFAFPPIGEWASCYFDHRGREWNNVDLRIIDDIGQKYPTGFHCFLNLDEAKEVYNEFKKNNYHNLRLCKCKSKYRMIFGIEKYSFVGIDEIIWAEKVVCRGLKIVEVLEG